jgi:hypothetical protein
MGQPLMLFSNKEDNSGSTGNDAEMQDDNMDNCSDLSNDEELKAEIAEFERRVTNPEYYEDFNDDESTSKTN